MDGILFYFFQNSKFVLKYMSHMYDILSLKNKFLIKYYIFICTEPERKVILFTHSILPKEQKNETSVFNLS